MARRSKDTGPPPAGSTPADGPTPRRRASLLAFYVGIAFAIAGFTAIGLAWNFAAEVDRIQGQFPYFVSGGLSGLGLIFVGVMILVIETLRRDSAEHVAQVRRLTETIEDLNAGLAPREVHDPAAGGEHRPRPRLSGNGGSAADTRPLPPAGGGHGDAGN